MQQQYRSFVLNQVAKSQSDLFDALQSVRRQFLNEISSIEAICRQALAPRLESDEKTAFRYIVEQTRKHYDTISAIDMLSAVRFVPGDKVGNRNKLLMLARKIDTDSKPWWWIKKSTHENNVKEMLK